MLYEPLSFFHRVTRDLSRFELRIVGETPYFLNLYTSRENAQLRINLSNPDLGFGGEEVTLPRNSIHIERDWVIAGGAIFHKAIFRNYTRLRVDIPLDYLFAVRIVGGCGKTAARGSSPTHFAQALEQRHSAIAGYEASWSTISASHEPLDSLLRRSSADLTSVTRDAPEGTFMMAGIP